MQGVRPESAGGRPSIACEGDADILLPPSEVAAPSALAANHTNEGPLGETGWVLLGDGWLLRAPDNYRLRLNICERALLLALANADDHAISFDAFFHLMATTRAVYGQKPLALTSKRMILMRLMKKLACSTSPGPLLSVHGWGYRLRVEDELHPPTTAARRPLTREVLLQAPGKRFSSGGSPASL